MKKLLIKMMGDSFERFEKTQDISHLDDIQYFIEQYKKCSHGNANKENNN